MVAGETTNEVVAGERLITRNNGISERRVATGAKVQYAAAELEGDVAGNRRVHQPDIAFAGLYSAAAEARAVAGYGAVRQPDYRAVGSVYCAPRPDA